MCPPPNPTTRRGPRERLVTGIAQSLDQPWRLAGIIEPEFGHTRLVRRLEDEEQSLAGLFNDVG
jgi:hypothetical protein